VATTQTVNLPGNKTGPHGGTQFRFDFFADDGVTPADRSVATRCNVSELLGGAVVSEVGFEAMREGMEVALGMKGMSAQQAVSFLANWAL
jgi:hypothetical protein